MQTLIVILIVAGCALWLGWYGYRFFNPKPGGKACGGNCCENDAKPALAAPKGERLVMISSDDIRARLKARKV